MTGMKKEKQEGIDFSDCFLDINDRPQNHRHKCIPVSPMLKICYFKIPFLIYTYNNRDQQALSGFIKPIIQGVYLNFPVIHRKKGSFVNVIVNLHAMEI